MMSNLLKRPISTIQKNYNQLRIVDIGLKNDGLIHISELADKFVKDPSQIVQIGESVSARVTKIDLVNLKVNLSLKNMD